MSLLIPVFGGRYDARAPMRNLESFGSQRAHLVLSEQALFAVENVGGDEAAVAGVSDLASSALTATLGPLGAVLQATAAVGDLQEEGAKSPKLPRWELAALMAESSVIKMCQAQVPRELYRASAWPSVDWFRPVLYFPRGAIESINVKWTSAVKWRAVGREFSTDIHFWSVPRLRRSLVRWGYPLA